MNKKDLDILIRMGEGFTVEFKRAGTSNIGRELCAFANATGGTLLIGVNDDGVICGVAEHNRLKSSVQSVARSIDPPLSVDIESVDEVLVVTVPAQNSKPYSFAGKFYLREGASSQQLAREEIREFFFKEGLIHFDEMGCDRFSLETDLSADSFRQFALKAKIPEDIDMMHALENLHLVREGRMTNAGAWLLASDIQKFSASGFVSCALFMGRSGINILDRKNFTGSVQGNFQEIVIWLLSKLNTELIITGTGREERPELPVDALREALVNALVHRNYRSKANVQVHVYHDRVEIISPGGLPAGMKEKDIGFKSVPRNPLLFSMFYRMDLVEQIGSGIRRIRQLCHDYGISAPQIRVEDNWVTVVFERVAVENGGDTTQVTTQVTTHVATQVVAILEALEKPLSRRELQEKLGLRNREHFRKQYLKPALKAGLIVMSNPDKPRAADQKYSITELGRSVLADG